MSGDSSTGSGPTGLVTDGERWDSSPLERSSRKDEDWGTWEDEVRDYVDATEPGMRYLLIEITNSATTIDDFEGWSRQQILMQSRVGGMQGVASLWGESTHLWRALNVLTDTRSDARKSCHLGSRPRNGQGAWQRLHQHFGQDLAAEQGLVINKLSHDRQTRQDTGGDPINGDRVRPKSHLCI